MLHGKVFSPPYKVTAVGNPAKMESSLMSSEGVPDARTPDEKKHYFLRRVPADPVSGEPWGLRSYASPADDPREGADVYDVYSRGEGAGLNGISYREW